MFNYHDMVQKQGIDLQSILIIDDCLGAIKWGDDFWTQVVTTCRQFGISIWIITQYLNKIPPVVRASTSYYFFLKMISKRELDACYEQCFPWMTKDEFNKFIQTYTEGYQAIMVDNKTQSNDPKSMYKIVQAPKSYPNFILTY